MAEKSQETKGVKFGFSLSMLLEPENKNMSSFIFKAGGLPSKMGWLTYMGLVGYCSQAVEAAESALCLILNNATL